ncbi:GNAT family N-acetyltransferase [Bailinhaonella thermotolerans]|uniref:N-acetyltransferase n=1 Tax=Bailinhaonella thermotolerans TaxID=1070861 RepID=A0A3A4B772_9ACTN|nr:GNAT family N-acetyltransferase [Bailinhaonella thermotolerans]RJL34071.1 N-acetyltransferase [Bailinhaonella thermotolerans]
MGPVEYAGERLVLREVECAHADALHALYGDSRATRHLPFEPRTREEVVRIIEEARASAAADPRRLYVLSVIDPEDGDVIGVARLHVEHDHPHSAEIGFGLRPDHWGRGLGVDLVRLLLRFGFKEVGLHRIWGARSPDNIASQLVMLTAGMVEEGRIRHHVRTPDGWRDSIVHSVLEDEWDGRRLD